MKRRDTPVDYSGCNVLLLQAFVVAAMLLLAPWWWM